MRLTVKVLDEVSHRGEDFSDLIIFHNGEEIFSESDRMDPEDATFGRSLQWIAPLLEKVYKLGFNDGYDECFIQEHST